MIVDYNNSHKNTFWLLENGNNLQEIKFDVEPISLKKLAK